MQECLEGWFLPLQVGEQAGSGAGWNYTLFQVSLSDSKKIVLVLTNMCDIIFVVFPKCCGTVIYLNILRSKKELASFKSQYPHHLFSAWLIYR